MVEEQEQILNEPEEEKEEVVEEIENLEEQQQILQGETEDGETNVDVEGEEGDVNEGENLEENLEDAGNGNLVVEVNGPRKGVNYFSRCLTDYNPKLVNRLLPKDRYLLGKEWEPKQIHTNERHFAWIQLFHKSVKAYYAENDKTLE